MMKSQEKHAIGLDGRGRQADEERGRRDDPVNLKHKKSLKFGKNVNMQWAERC